MTDTILAYVHDVVTSPWIYLVVLALAWVDGFLPAFPSESVVITAGVFAANGAPNLPLVIAVAAVGAFAGDHTSYLIGRLAGERLLRRSPEGTRRRRAFERAATALAVRGGLVLVVARYIPGGRTAATLTMGTVGYRVRRFTPYAALAAVTWATYAGVIGYVGGVAFEADPLRGLLFGLGLAVGITVIVEVVRYVRRRRGCSSRARRSTKESASSTVSYCSGVSTDRSSASLSSTRARTTR